MSFKSWPVAWKVISLLLLLALASFSGIIYTTHEITVVDGLDSAIIEGADAAITNLSRARRFMIEAEAGIYSNIVAESDQANAAAAAKTSEAIKGYDGEIATAKKVYPGLAEDFDAVAAKFHAAMSGVCGDIIRQANASTTAEENFKIARSMEQTCVPALAQITAASGKVNARLIAAKNEQDQAVTVIADRASLMSLISLGVATLAILILAFFVVRLGIVAPITASIATMGALGRGELGKPVAGTDRRDEIGAIAKALEILRGQLQTAETARREQLAREETERQQLARREKLANSFVTRMQDLASGFAQSSGEVAGAARNLSATAEETSRQAQAVALAAEEAAANVQTVAASSEEMAASVKEINGQVAHSANVANTAFHEAEASNSRIGTLATAAAAIGDVINLIKGIADQTNLLALNATIEAARAGEAGKGFAVVAAEVKQLASQTAKATDEIGSKVAEIQQATDGTVKSMTEIVRVIGDIKSIASAIAGAIEEQGAATGEIARNCQQAAVGTQQVTQNIAGVGQAAEMTGSASTQLMSLSDGLSAQATSLRGVVETFVKDFAAA